MESAAISSNFSIYSNKFKRVCAPIIDNCRDNSFVLLVSFDSIEKKRLTNRRWKNHVLGWLTKWSTVFVGLSFFVLQKVVPVTRPVFEVVPMFLLVWVNIQYCPASSFQIDRFQTDTFFASYHVKLNEEREHMDIRETRFFDSLNFFPSIYIFRLRNRIWKHWKYYCLPAFINVSNSCFRTREENENFQREKSLIRSILWLWIWLKITLLHKIYLLYRRIDFSLRNYRH